MSVLCPASRVTKATGISTIHNNVVLKVTIFYFIALIKLDTIAITNIVAIRDYRLPSYDTTLTIPDL